MITETKFDKNFLIRIFLYHYFSLSCRFDRNANGGGILIVGEDFPLNLLSVELHGVADFQC